MSRGLGRVERIVEETLRNADRSFIIEELCLRAYPKAEQIEKKHKVAVLRTLKKTAYRLPLWFWDTYLPPWRIVIANRSSVRSFFHGHLRCDCWQRSVDDIDRILNEPLVQAEMQPPLGVLWVQVDIHNREVDLKTAYEKYEQENEASVAEYERLINEVHALRCYLSDVTGSCELDGTFFYRFEPGHKLYEWAMKHQTPEYGFLTKPRIESTLHEMWVGKGSPAIE